MDEAKPGRRREPLWAHVLTIQEAWIQHRYVFDVGRTLDPSWVRDRLLDTDMGVAAVNLASGEVEHARRMEGLARQRDLLQQLADDLSRIRSGDRSAVGMIVRHPRILLDVLRRSGRQQSGSSESIPEDPVADSNWYAAIQEIDEQVSRASLLEQLLSAVDQEQLRPGYLFSEPWTRVTLQSFGATRTLDGEEEWCDVSLLAHRSGVLVLSLYVQHTGSMHYDDLVRVSWGTQPQFRCTNLALGIAKAAASRHRSLVVTGEDRFSSGVTWRTFTHDEPIGVSDMAVLYMDALHVALDPQKPRSRRAASGRSWSDDWSAYPTMSIRRYQIKDRRSALDREVGALLARVPSVAEWSASFLEDVAADAALESGAHMNCWAAPGAALLLPAKQTLKGLGDQYGALEHVPGQEWIVMEQRFGAVVERALIADHAVRALEASSLRIPLTSRDLVQLQARQLLVQSEFFGETPYVAASLSAWDKHVRDQRTLPERWRAATTAVGLVADVVASRNSEDSTRRELRQQAILGVLALLIGIPALSATLKLLADVHEVGDGDYLGAGRLINAASHTAQRDAAAVIVLAMAVSLMGILWTALPRREKQRELPQHAAGELPRRRPFQYPVPTPTGPLRIVDRQNFPSTTEPDPEPG